MRYVAVPIAGARARRRRLAALAWLLRPLSRSADPEFRGLAQAVRDAADMENPGRVSARASRRGRRC